MKALEFRKWLNWNFEHDNIAEDADIVVLLPHLDGGYIYPNNPIIDEDGDVLLDGKE